MVIFVKLFMQRAQHFFLQPSFIRAASLLLDSNLQLFAGGLAESHHGVHPGSGPWQSVDQGCIGTSHQRDGTAGVAYGGLG